jgi:hypothetical protein
MDSCGVLDATVTINVYEEYRKKFVTFVMFECIQCALLLYSACHVLPVLGHSLFYHYLKWKRFHSMHLVL